MSSLIKKTATLSLWVGYFSEEAQLEEYVEINYDEEEEPGTSVFWNDYKIKYVDIDSQEIGWENQPASIEKLIEGASYWLSYIDKVKAEYSGIDISKYNSMILIFDYEYNAEISEISNTRFLGSYEYIAEY